ncbi:hypothetical protein BH10CYA1_BH10CYA1_64390 [soil metagenome]
MSRPEQAEMTSITSSQPMSEDLSGTFSRMTLADARAPQQGADSSAIHLPSPSEILGDIVKVVSDTVNRITGGQVNGGNGGGGSGGSSKPSETPKDTCPDEATRKALGGNCG